MNTVNTLEDFKNWAKENKLDDKSSPLYFVACNIMEKLEHDIQVHIKGNQILNSR